MESELGQIFPRGRRQDINPGRVIITGARSDRPTTREALTSENVFFLQTHSSLSLGTLYVSFLVESLFLKWTSQLTPLVDKSRVQTFVRGKSSETFPL